MSKLRLGCVVLLIVGWSSAAWANLTSDPTPVDAGAVVVNSNKTVNAVLTSNVDPPGLDSFDHFHVDGADADCARFTVTAPGGPTNVDSSATMPFTVRFAPLATGLVECTVAIHTAAHIPSGTAFVVRGTGTDPRITAPTAASFPDTRAIANTTSSQTVQIQSTGTGDLVISALAVAVSPGQFTIQNPPTLPLTIASGNAVTLTLLFNPGGPGVRTGRLDITSNDPLDGVHEVDLDGIGTNGRIAVADAAAGLVNLGASGTATIAVTNNAVAPVGPLAVTSATITGGGGAFTFANNGFGCTGAACTFGTGFVAPRDIDVVCSPTGNQTGTLTGTVTFVSDTDAGGDAVASVTCQVGRADAAVTPSPIAFANVAVGATVVRTGTVTNNGTIDLVYTATKTGARNAEYTLSGCITACVVPANGGTRTFDLSLTPSLPRGGANITVVITSNDPDNATINHPVTANVTAPIITAPATQAFPARRVANATLLTASQNITIQNTGDAALQITALATTGDFSIPTPPTLPATIAASGSLVVAVVFDPSLPGARTGSFDIASTDPATPTKTVVLSGTGTTAIIAVTDVSFGTVNLGQTTTQTIAVTNSSTNNPGPLTITSATIVGGDGWFTFDANGFGCLGNPTCTFGAAGVVAPQNIGVRCTPPAGSTGTMMATVTFASDSDGGGDNVSSLMCTAGRADATVDPTSLAYGNVEVTVPVLRTVAVTNSGNINLTFTAAKLGARAGEYTFAGCFTACVVPAGQTRSFDLTFNPTARGPADITVAVTSNDPDNGTINIPVTANAIAPLIATNPAATLQFGNVEVVTTATLDIVLTNTGDADLDISTATFTTNDGSYALTAGDVGPQTIPPAGTATWTITCTPATINAHDGNFRISSNALGVPVRNIALRCNGTEGILVVIPTTIDFLGVQQDTTQTRPYTLRNTGNLAVADIAAVLDPANVGYSLDPATPIPATLAAGAQISLNVIFAPLTGTDGGPATVTFTGTWGTGAKPLRAPAVLSLNGDGLVTGFDVTPNPVAFGDMRFDATTTRTFCIQSTSQLDIAITTITITPDPGTDSSEFTVTAIRRKTCGTGANPAPISLPQTLAPAAQLEVTVVADPANRIGALSARLAVTSNLPANPTRDLMLTGNSITATIALSCAGSICDFGAVDVQGPGVTQDVTITNTGAATLDLASFARSDNGANAHFTFALPPTTALAPSQTLTIPITYKPLVVTIPDESIVLSSAVAGVVNAPATQMITLRGRGIDRQISLVKERPTQTSYRNPADQAPVERVTVTNTGEVQLVISATMLTDTLPTTPPACAPTEPVWTLLNPGAVTIAPGQMHVFEVRFSPAVIGPASATMVLTNDDDVDPMATVTFTGTAIDRGVAFDATTIDLGYTGIGIPVTLDEVMRVANMNMTDEFKIARIELIGANAGSFSISNSPTDVTLAAGGEQLFAMTFDPDGEGTFSAAANLFIDSDPCPQGVVEVRGTAVFVDAHGGGGCSTGTGAGGGVLLLAVVAFVLRRRRAVVATVVFGVLVVAVPVARADDIVLTVFDPTPATVGTGFNLQHPEVGKPGDWVVSAIVSHAMNPLVLTCVMCAQGSDGPRDLPVVERSTLVELGGAYAFLGRFEAGARMPFYTQSGAPLGDPRTEFTTRPADGGAAGDLTLHGKAQLVNGSSGKLAAALQLTLPTASEGEFTGVDKPSGRVLLLGALNPNTLKRRIMLSANLGGVLRARSRFANLEQGSGVAWGLGVSVRALDRVWFGAEVFGDIVPSGRRESDMATTTLSPTEWLVGLRWFPDHRFSVAVAGGRGLTSSAGSPELRGVLLLTFAPGAPKLAPLHITQPELPEGDADRDGIGDRSDECKTEAEDKDLFDDADGCPDPDNDRDGIADTADKCPLDPEDRDKVQDEDGCPDKDNDGDGRPDAGDRCPNEPEDKDGFEDLDGCPELDNDGDGILDGKDKCPGEPETINGNKDEDGCPDPGDTVIVLSPDRIETLDPIQFTGATAKLAKSSFTVLGQVGATLRARPEIIRVRVTCHVQPTGSWEKDQELSDKRSQAVRDWLVQWGIAANRVEARGFGGTKPLAPASQKGSQAINDRIELIILERK